MKKRIVIMLMFKGVDAVRINIDFDKMDWNFFIGQLIDTAAHHETNFIPVSNKKINGITTTLFVEGKRLQVSVLQCMKSKWISYSFKGSVPVKLFDDATCLFGEHSFVNALQSCRVKRLELAIDYVGLHTTQFISHFRGVKKSHVASNDIGNGFTQYSGSREGGTQLVVYDKSQEIRDKGGVPLCEKLLRIELRFQNRGCSLLDLIADLLKDDPFEKVMVVNKDAALKHATEIKAWPIFLSCCSDLGVASALRQFPQHKKSFLAALKTPALQTRIPSMADFEKPLVDLLSALI